MQPIFDTTRVHGTEEWVPTIHSGQSLKKDDLVSKNVPEVNTVSFTEFFSVALFPFSIPAAWYLAVDRTAHPDGLNSLWCFS